jgi:CubicO group peptidase (beta-lactamase class C family)
MEDSIMKKIIILRNLFIVTVCSLVFNACLKEDSLKMPFQTYTPPDMADGWEIATPADVNIDGEALKEVYKWLHESDDIWQIRSLLVFRDNKLVAESYMKDGSDRIKPAAAWSCTKQVTGILTGIAIENNYIESLTDPISKYLPQTLNTDKSLITIENLLMMKSGINFSNDGLYGESAKLTREIPDHSLDFILGLDMRSTPGTKYNYNDGDPHIISAIIQERTGKTMRDWAKEVLFDKIGINRIEWRTYKDGITMGCFGILITPRELGKIGQLMLNDGKWGNEQIVNNAWISEMTSSKVSADETKNKNVTFGYQWWKDTERDILMMRGHGGQFVFINKSKKLIVVIMSEPNTQDPFQLSLSKNGYAIYDRINSITN